MENKKLKKPIQNELDDDALDNVSAGIEVGDEELLTINVWDFDMDLSSRSFRRECCLNYEVI